MSLHFVLDGYNLVKQDEYLGGLKLEAGRNGLLKLIETRELRGSRSNLLTVVFDGQLGGFSQRYPSGIEVVFTNLETADDWIKRFVEGSKAPKNIVVVTDDREIRHYVKALGAALMGTRQFLNGGRHKTFSDEASKLKRQQSDRKEISSVLEHKITAELSKVWLKDNKKS